jgi:hypothetical protein
VHSSPTDGCRPSVEAVGKHGRGIGDQRVDCRREGWKVGAGHTGEHKDAGVLPRHTPVPPGAVQHLIVPTIQRHEGPTVERRVPQLRIIGHAFAAFDPCSRCTMPTRGEERSEGFGYIFIEIECRHNAG